MDNTKSRDASYMLAPNLGGIAGPMTHQINGPHCMALPSPDIGSPQWVSTNSVCVQKIYQCPFRGAECLRSSGWKARARSSISPLLVWMRRGVNTNFDSRVEAEVSKALTCHNQRLRRGLEEEAFDLSREEKERKEEHMLTLKGTASKRRGRGLTEMTCKIKVTIDKT